MKKISTAGLIVSVLGVVVALSEKEYLFAVLYLTFALGNIIKIKKSN